MSLTAPRVVIEHVVHRSSGFCLADFEEDQFGAPRFPVNEFARPEP